MFYNKICLILNYISIQEPLKEFMHISNISLQAPGMSCLIDYWLIGLRFKGILHI